MCPVGRRPWFLAAAVVIASAAAGVGLALALAGGGESGTAGDPGALDLHPVAGAFEPDRTRLAECGEDRACLEQAFGNLVYEEGPKAALAEFRARIASDPDVEAGCHRIAHVMGSAALARFRGDVAQAFARGDSTCWSGYYHGILERAFLGVRDKQGLVAAARRVCADADLRESLWLTYQCVHGLGHGLMIQTGYDLPFSLDVCERLEGEWDQSSCTGGVFMENVNAAEATAYGPKSPWLKEDDLVYPCDDPVTEGRRLYCYLMVTSRILQANGYDWQATARTCARVAPGWVATCFQSFGRDASGSTRQDSAGIKRLCRYAGRYEGECVYGAARDMTANYSSGRQAARLCATVSVGLRARCYEGIGTILGTISTDEPGRRRLCAELGTRRYLGDCLRGAGVPTASASRRGA